MSAAFKIISTALCFSLLSGCCAVFSNEGINSFFSSKSERIDEFKEHNNLSIGKPYYGFKKHICSGNRTCVINKDGDLEVTSVSSVDRNCPITLVVNQSTAGKYVHPTNGIEMDIIGHIKSWSYVSDNVECLYTVNSCGPW